MNKDTAAAVVQDPEVLSPRMEIARLPPKVADALVLRREPNKILKEATKAAKALMAVMAQKPDKVMMNGQQYIENEDWLTIGHFYGVTAQLETDRYVEFGEVQGWEATAILVARDGRVLGRAVAMCLNDEEKWSTRPKKEWAYCLGPEDDHSKHGHNVEDPGGNMLIWEPNPNKPGGKRPKKARVVTGEEKVPLFQLRSMAQTRASSKVHASVLRFVPVLAGFKATPAEELPDAERVANTPAASPAPVSAAADPPATPTKHPSVRNGGDSGQSLPPGYYAIGDYRLKDGWHEVTLLHYDAQGGALKCSTKMRAVGELAEAAWLSKRPIKVDVTMKQGTKGEAYLNKVEPLKIERPGDLDEEIARRDLARQAGEVI